MLMTRRPGSPVKKPHLEHMKRRIKVVERRSSSMRLSTRVKWVLMKQLNSAAVFYCHAKKTVTGSMNTHDHDDVSENAAGLWS